MLPSCKRTWGTKPFTWPQTNVGLLSKCCLKFNAIRTIHSRQKANRSFSIRCLHMKGHHHGCGIRNCWRHVFFLYWCSFTASLKGVSRKCTMPCGTCHDLSYFMKKLLFNIRGECSKSSDGQPKLDVLLNH